MGDDSHIDENPNAGPQHAARTAVLWEGNLHGWGGEIFLWV